MGAVNVARAGNEHNRREQHLDCRFKDGVVTDIGKGGKGKGAIAEIHYCRVHARVCDHDGNDDDILATAINDNVSSSDGEHNRCHSRFRVECDGRDVYEDGAYRNHFDGYEFLQARDREIILKFPKIRREDDDLSSHGDDRLHASWLKLDGFVFEGWCSIDNDDDNHHN